MMSETDLTQFNVTLETLRAKLTPEALAQIGGVYAFHFKDLGTTQTLDAHSRDGRGWLTSSPATNNLIAQFEVTITSADFVELVAGRLHPMAGMATGRMQLRGSMKEAIKLDRLLKA